MADSDVFRLFGNMRAGDMFIVNATRVLPARLLSRDGISIQLLEPQPGPPAGANPKEQLWSALAKPLRRLYNKQTLQFRPLTPVSAVPELQAGIIGISDRNIVTLAFQPVADMTFTQLLGIFGRTPLPPYIKRDKGDVRREQRDRQDYQSVFARIPGAVAAPTACLHFSEKSVKALTERGVVFSAITLHVSGGSFLPMQPGALEAHKVRPERVEVSQTTVDDIGRARQAGARIVVVGTTALRALVTACRQAPQTTLRPYAGDTDLCLYPGPRGEPINNPLPFADALLTNFHAPQSSLLALVAALLGYETMRRCYSHALESGYRFLSFGDASLIDLTGAFSGLARTS